MIKFKNKEDDYFSDDDQELHDSNYEESKFVVIHSQKKSDVKLNYEIEDKSQIEVSKKELELEDKKYNDEIEIINSIESCYLEMKRYCEENNLILSDCLSLHYRLLFSV